MQYLEFKRTPWFQEMVRSTSMMEDFHRRYVKGHEIEGVVLKKFFALYLISKGFKARYVKKIDDIIICVKDKDYTFLYLKYN